MQIFTLKNFRRYVRRGAFGIYCAVMAFANPFALADDLALDEFTAAEVERVQINNDERALRSAEYVRLGEELLQARQYNAAAEQFLFALGIDPNSEAAKRGQQEALRYLEAGGTGNDNAVGRVIAQAQVREEYNLVEVSQYLSRAQNSLDRAVSPINAVNAAQKEIMLDERLRLLDEVDALVTRAALRMEGIAADGQIGQWKNEVAEMRRVARETRERYTLEFAELRRSQAEKQVAKEQRQVGKIIAQKRGSMFAQARDYMDKLDFMPALAIADELLLDNPGDQEARDLLVEIRQAQTDRRSVVIDDLRRDRRVSMLQKIDQDAIANVSQGNPVRYPKDWDALVAKKKIKRKVVNEEITAEKQATLRKIEEQYSGFQFTEAPLAEVVLDNIRMRTGININAAGIPEDKAEKEINLIPHNMRLSSIFKHILRQVNNENENDNTNLTYVVNDQGIINFVTKAALEKDLEIKTKVVDIHDIISPATSAKKLTGRSMNVYGEDPDTAEPVPLADLIQRALPDDFGDGNERNSSLQFDEVSKKIIAKGNVEQLARLDELLGKMRAVQSMQVSISAHYLKIRDDFWEHFKSEFGNFANYANATNGYTSVEVPNNFTRNSINSGITSGGFPPNYFTTISGSMYNGMPTGFSNVFNHGTPEGDTSGQGFNAGINTSGILGGLQAGWFLQMLRKNARNDELFAPHLVVFNNHYGWIQFLTQVPYVESYDIKTYTPNTGTTGNPAVQRNVPVPDVKSVFDGCSLEIMPSISPDRKYVSVRMLPKINKIESFEAQTVYQQYDTATPPNPIPGTGVSIDLPTVSRFETATDATLPDGGSIILSGLSTNIDGNGRQGTPILMDLPFIGNAFSNRFYQKSKETYTCLVSAKIIILEDEEAAQTNAR